MLENFVFEKRSRVRMSVVSTIIGGCSSSGNLPEESGSKEQDQGISANGELVEKHELLDQAIDSLLLTHGGLRRGFKRGRLCHPFIGDVGERWIPLSTICTEAWSTGEAKIAAILVDIFHDEYGADQIAGYNRADMYVDGKCLRPSEWLWPNVRVVTKEFTYLDRESYSVLSNLVRK